MPKGKYEEFIPETFGAGRATRLKHLGPRDPKNSAAAGVINTVHRLKSAAEKKTLSREDFLRAAGDAGNFRGQQDRLNKMLRKVPDAADELADFTIRKTGTVAEDVRKSVGLSKYGSTFGEVAEKAKSAYNSIKPQLKALFKTASSEIAEAAKGGDKGAISAMKSAAFKSVKGGFLPAVILSQVLPDISEIVATAKKDAMRQHGA